MNDETPLPHLHEFDPVSGWCTGCHLRDDGRALDLGGSPIAPPRLRRYPMTTNHEIGSTR